MKSLNVLWTLHMNNMLQIHVYLYDFALNLNNDCSNVVFGNVEI